MATKPIQTTGPEQGLSRVPLSQALVEEYNRGRYAGAQPCLCYSPFKSLYFGIKGNVVSCCQNRKMVLGTYPKDSIKEIWEGAQIKRLRGYMLDNDLSGGCSRCHTHLLNRNFGAVVAQKFDSLPYDPHYPTSMEFELHNICNLECEMCCGELSSLIRRRRDKLPPTRCVYDTAFVEQLEEFIPHLHQTTFFGGEPFLNKIYYDIWDRLIEINPACEIVVQTNATVVNKKIREYLVKGNFKIGISLDSIDQGTYEKIRVNAKYDRVMKNIEYFHDYSTQRGNPITFAMCVMKNNWCEVPDLIEFARERNAFVYFNTVWVPKELSLWYQGSKKLKQICDYYEQFSFAGSNVIDIVNQRNFEGYQSLLKSWLEFMQFFDAADLDFRDAIENPLQLKRVIKKIKQDNQDFLGGTGFTNPFGVDIEMIASKSMSELVSDLL